MVDVAHRRWDFTLTVVTVVLLASLGVQSFAGTLYSWWAQGAVVAWQSVGYDQFVAWMNAVAAPQIVALVVVMGLCVPKRLFDRGTLLAVSAAMVTAGAVVTLATASVGTGLAVYLLLAGSIQVAVVAMTVAGARGPSYMTEGRLTKTGSGMLHLGFIVFAFVVVALQHSRLMVYLFAIAAALMISGTALSFYAGKLAFGRRVIPSGPTGDAASSPVARPGPSEETQG